MNNSILKYPYQINLYERLKELIDDGKRSISLSSAPSLGKSYIIAELIKNSFVGKKILYVSFYYGNNSYVEDIFTNYRVNFTSWINFTTFKQFQGGVSSYYKDYDVLIVDQAERLLSDVCGPIIQELGDEYVENGKIFLGITSYPFRHIARLKDDVDCRLFFEEHVDGFGLLESMREGIFRKVIYRNADPEREEEFHQTTLPDAEKPHFHKAYTVESTADLLSNIFEEFPENNHFLVFFKNVTEMEYNLNLMKEIFPDFTYFSTSSHQYKYKQRKWNGKLEKVKKTSDDLIELCETFDRCKGKAFLFSVDQLIGGIHTQTADGVLFYRNTNSEYLFSRVLGTILRPNMDKYPIFIDFFGSGLKFMKLKTIWPREKGLTLLERNTRERIMYPLLFTAPKL